MLLFHLNIHKRNNRDKTYFYRQKKTYVMTLANSTRYIAIDLPMNQGLI